MVDFETTTWRKYDLHQSFTLHFKVKTRIEGSLGKPLGVHPCSCGFLMHQPHASMQSISCRHMTCVADGNRTLVAGCKSHMHTISGIRHPLVETVDLKSQARRCLVHALHACVCMSLYARVWLIQGMGPRVECVQSQAYVCLHTYRCMRAFNLNPNGGLVCAGIWMK